MASRAFEFKYNCPRCETDIFYTIHPPVPSGSRWDQDDPGEVEGAENCPSCDTEIDHDTVLNLALLSRDEPEMENPDEDD